MPLFYVVQILLVMILRRTIGLLHCRLTYYALKQVIIAFGIEEWILFGLMIFFLPLQARAHIDLES